jgi:very-short-patch-repair endonuclease
LAKFPLRRTANTLTREKEDFRAIDDANVRLYVCGPTVYDFAHIGNARPVIVFDVLYRLLRHLYGADHVTYVRNITDVDDKINARALRDYPDLPLNEAIAKVTEKTADQFTRILPRSAASSRRFEPRATEHIGGMVEDDPDADRQGPRLCRLGPRGARCCSVTAPCRLRRPVEAQARRTAGRRAHRGGAHKKNPADFVLWKESSADEPGWDSRERRGRDHPRPARLAHRVLGDERASPGRVFDIHGGGLDLIFPHHENEIAQSCCAHGNDRDGQLWMHNGFLQVEGRKMSKSEGNFFTIHELLETEKFGGRKWPGEVLRLGDADDALPRADRFLPAQAGRGGGGRGAQVAFQRIRIESGPGEWEADTAFSFPLLEFERENGAANSRLPPCGGGVPAGDRGGYTTFASHAVVAGPQRARKMPHEEVSKRLRSNARRLRSDMTEAEKKLWQMIRAHRLEGIAFRRQMPIAGYIVDFAAPAHRLIVEVDGSQHGEIAGRERDDKRDEALQSLDWTVLRFWNADVLANLDGVCRKIQNACGKEQF